MSTRPKKKLEKLKSKKLKRNPIRQHYTEEEIEELKKKYNNIMYHLSTFLSEHNVYEAVPENVKIVVFNSDLNFHEMIKVFIFEDIYCGLIYDVKLNNYLGLVTTRDLMLLYRYIIDNFPSEEIHDFNIYLKDIFSNKKLSKIKEKDRYYLAESHNNINCDINIFEYLYNINYIDYLMYAKKIDFQNIRIHSVSLDDNLLETLQKINIKHIHRLLVEEDSKNNNNDLQNNKDGQKNENVEKKTKKIKSEINKGKNRNSLTEKTSTTNYSDEDNKNNAMLGKKEIKKMEDINEDSDELILEMKSKGEKHKEEIRANEEVRHVKKKILKKKKKVNNENKEEMPNYENKEDNYYEDNRIKDETKSRKKKIVRKEEIKRENTLETIDVNETENNKEEVKPNKRVIIKKKKTQTEENGETVESRNKASNLQESRTDDELKPKKIVKKKIIKHKRKTTNDIEMKTFDSGEKRTETIDNEEEKRIIKKKIIKKKVIKRKKTDISDDTSMDEIKNKKPRPETTRVNKYRKNNGGYNNDYSDDTSNIRYTTEATEETNERKERYELPKIKMKRRSVQNRIRISDDMKREDTMKYDNYPENRNIERYKIDNMDSKKYEKDEAMRYKNQLIKKKSEEYRQQKNKIIKKIYDNLESEEKESDNNNKENTSDDNENTKKDVDIITELLSNVNLEEMKNYIGIVTNETIFDYLLFNYYSNEMKEFNLSLNELLVLGDIPLIVKLTNGIDMNEKAYNTFNYYLFGQSDIIPVYNQKEIEGFIYPIDFYYYIYNCESKQSLTNEEFLIHLYKNIDEEKPYGKNRIIYMELNDANKGFYVKELFEKLDCSLEKKIVLYDPNDDYKLYLISLKTIFRAIVEFQLNNK